MANPVVTQIGQFAGPKDDNNTTSIVITTTADVPAGEAIILVVDSEGFTITPVSGVTDSAGNTYHDPIGSHVVFYVLNATALPSGSSITIATGNNPGATPTADIGVIVQVYAVTRLRSLAAFLSDFSSSDAGAVRTVSPPDVDLSAYVGRDVWAFAAQEIPSGPTYYSEQLTYALTAGAWSDLGRVDAGVTAFGPHPPYSYVDGSYDFAQKALPNCDGSALHYQATITAPASPISGNVFAAEVYILVFGFLASNDGPWNLQTRGGQYHFAYPQAGVTSYRYSFSSYPASLAGPYNVPGGGDDSQFRMCEENYPAGRSRGIWNRSGAILAARSDDEGQTWNTPPVTLWSGGKNPTVTHDSRTGKTLYACYVTDHLEGRIQGPGDSSPQAAFHLKLSGGADVPVDDAVFHIQPAWDTPDRWLLVLLDSGAVKNYVSTDDGPTWTAA